MGNLAQSFEGERVGLFSIAKSAFRKMFNHFSSWALCWNQSHAVAAARLDKDLPLPG